MFLKIVGSYFKINKLFLNKVQKIGNFNKSNIDSNSISNFNLFILSLSN